MSPPWITVRSFLGVCLVSIAFVLLSAASPVHGQQTHSRVNDPGLEQDADPVTLLAAGDIATCEYGAGHQAETAALLDTLSGDIAVLGDIAYPAGSYTDFLGCFEPAWGGHKERIRPVPGNHEYGTPGASGYYTYFGAAASPQEFGCIVNCKGYYSYDLGSWHIVALNSEAEMAAGSEQESWLRADLAANRTLCTLAYWHHPRFSSGGHGNNDRSAAVWQALYEAGVDVVLNGHDHDYERFAPQNPAGELDTARGIREFVVGTGGAPLRGFDNFQDNSEVSNAKSWGVLQFSLYPDHYEWTFRAIGGAFVDSGSSPCVSVASDWGSHINFPWIGRLPAQ